MVFKGSRYLKGTAELAQEQAGGNEEAAIKSVGPERTFNEDLGDKGVSLPSAPAGRVVLGKFLACPCLSVLICKTGIEQTYYMALL